MSNDIADIFRDPEMNPEVRKAIQNKLNDFNSMLGELKIITTYNEAGHHFTSWSEHYEAMEEKGLIKINRPVHPSGIPCDSQYWLVELTDLGKTFVRGGP